MINIAIGLPGSGKTTYFKSQAGTYIDGDSFSNLDDLITVVKLAPQPIWLDGLFLTSAVQHKLRRAFGYIIRWYYWTPDVNACLHNDSLRNRPLSSAITIRNSSVHKPSSSGVITMQTIKYDVFHDFLLALYPECASHFCSYTWSLSGTSGNCWNDELCHISADNPEPLSTVFSYSPNILTLISRLGYTTDQLLQHSEIFIEKSEGGGDYYGGYEERAWWQVSASDIIRVALADLHNLNASDLTDFKTQLPELFI